MQYALLTRPQWSGGALTTGFASEVASSVASEIANSDPRLIIAPLQQLELLPAEEPKLLNQSNQLNQSNKPNQSQFAALMQAAKPWLIFTSPASVHAFGVWAQQYIKAASVKTSVTTSATTSATAVASAPTNLHHARLAAVGSGTRDRLHDLVECGLITIQQIEQAICVEEKEKADAHGLLHELAQLAIHESIHWAAQSVWLVQGQGNRPILADGIKAMDATVFVLELYRRIDCDWPSHVMTQLKNAVPGQAGVVLTSTTVVDRALQLLRINTVDPKGIVWCTQHKAIADRLHLAGVAPLSAIRRVQLDAQYLMKDLFEHEIYW